MATLIQVDNGVAKSKFRIDKALLRLGRSVENDICIEDPEVSGEHCIIEMIAKGDKKDDYEFFVQDMGSTNHTFLNGQQISRQQLRHNDMIRVGWKYFKFVDESQQSLEDTKMIHKSWIPGVYYTK
ncbi:MAG: FHA domain-containing protein [Gammaproteobacteria bacterium]|jgi:pSer/pThr/pTyr-binding forkhead associated (FHA) protein